VGGAVKTIFYSWASDHDNNTNRGFIRKALDQAAKGLATAGHVEESPRVEQDTRGIPGSPNVFDTICMKIRGADVFVADVTLMPGRAGLRPTPNPNVLLELGFALAALGDERTLLVMNLEHGEPRELPFDLGLKRVLPYKCRAGDEEKAGQRTRLAIALQGQLKLVLDATNRGAELADRGQWLGRLMSVLGFMLPRVERFLSAPAGGLDLKNLAHSLNTWAIELHRLAAEPCAFQADLVTALAVRSDSLIAAIQRPGQGDILAGGREVLESALRIRDELADPAPVDGQQLEGVRETVRSASSQLTVLVGRMDGTAAVLTDDQWACPDLVDRLNHVTASDRAYSSGLT
jgi:hypothetical protein